MKHFDDGHFGVCPRCVEEGRPAEPWHLNIERENWCYCPVHRVKWSIGWNLLESWREETEDIWRKNWALLDGCEEVEPAHCHCGGCIWDRVLSSAPVDEQCPF